MFRSMPNKRQLARNGRKIKLIGKTQRKIKLKSKTRKEWTGARRQEGLVVGKMLVDVCGGPMTLEQINREVVHYMLGLHKPKRLIIDIKRRKKGYYAVIWMSRKDFGRNERSKE